MIPRQEPPEPPGADASSTPEPSPQRKRRPFDTVRLELDALQAMLGPPLDGPRTSPEDKGRDPP